MSERLNLEYIGFASLMGRLVKWNQLSEQDKQTVARAYRDVNKHLAKAGSATEFVRATPGCFAAFERESP